MRRQARALPLESLRDERGQISVFVALIFQVLFVFFAMVVNIGLLVHDKINLQNAVDLGAYYAAQKQAEILNEIAHVNYQIRQDNKLLAWRYRVLGTLGKVGQDRGAGGNQIPSRRRLDAPLTETQWMYPGYGPLDDGGEEIPTVCVANDLWSDTLVNGSENENYCFRSQGNGIPKIPRMDVVAPFVPMIGLIAAYNARARQIQSKACADLGPLNWAFTMQIFYAYKLSVASRKAVIRKLRENLVRQGDAMVDQNMAKVRDGVINTIKKNLTASNLAGFSDEDVTIINGLDNEYCKGGVLPGENTLPEVRISPLLFFNYQEDTGSTCDNLRYKHEDEQFLQNPKLNDWDPHGLMRSIARGEPELPTELTHSSLGYEKNPWCMAYMGVKVKTKARQPFSPFGKAVDLVARSFAQPFGGRIGPWYKTLWPRGSNSSAGSERTDPLTPLRVNNGAIDFSGSAESTHNRGRLPNYSRYPGDRLGLKSVAAIGAQRKIFADYRSKPKDQRLWLRFYSNFERIPQTGDPLAWDPDSADLLTPAVIPLRDAEIAAIAPDLFDATYYSIEPGYSQYYLRLSQSNPARFGTLPSITTSEPMRPAPDIGGRNNGPDGIQFFSVIDQVPVANNPAITDAAAYGSNVIFWIIRDWRHLLTGWTANKAQDFGNFPVGKFGKCETEAHRNFLVPGRCAVGGRTGYSVRLISKDHLLGTWNIGGEGQSGTILNPPHPDF